MDGLSGEYGGNPGDGLGGEVGATAADSNPAGESAAYGPGINDGAFGKGLDGGLIGTEFGGKSAPGNPDGVGLGSPSGNFVTSFFGKLSQNINAKGAATSLALGGKAGLAGYGLRGFASALFDGVTDGLSSVANGLGSVGGASSASSTTGYSGEGGDRTGLGSVPMGWTTPSAAPLRGAAMASPAEVLMAHAKPKAPYEIKVTTQASSGSDTGSAALAALAVAGIALL